MISIAELAHGEKLRTQSNCVLNHSLTHLVYLMPQKPKLVLRDIYSTYTSNNE